MSRKKLDLILTRDYCLATNELWCDIINAPMKSFWGVGVSSQLAFFTSKTTEMYRSRLEFDKLKNLIFKLPIGDERFGEWESEKFRAEIGKLRSKILSRGDKLNYAKGDLESVLDYFRRIYPIFAISFYVSGIWRDEWNKQRGKRGSRVLARLVRNRELSNGIFEETDMYLRSVGGQLLRRTKDADFLRLDEIFQLSEGQIVKNINFKSRHLGYFVYQGKMGLARSRRAVEERFNISLIFPNIVNEREMKGVVASSRGGTIKGSVQLVMNNQSVKKFKKGNILVSPMTSPMFISAIKKAKAVITNEGGMTCHAAITCRELDIPCIIGTRVATMMLKDGDRVELDMNMGKVKVL